MKPYPSLATGLADACQLARGMSYKFAAADFPLGGAKAVIALPPEWDDLARRELLRRFGAPGVSAPWPLPYACCAASTRSVSMSGFAALLPWAAPHSGEALV